MADARLQVLAREALEHLESHETQYELCAYCPKMCRFACPVSEAEPRESLTPWGKMSAPFLTLKGGLPLATAFETSWACTGCGHCTDYCLHGNDVPTALGALRAAGVSAGIPSPVTAKVVAAFRKSGNVHGRDPGLRERTPAALRDDGRSPALLIPGCGDDGASLRHAVSIVEKLGGRGVTIAVDGSCCGSALWWAGRPDLFDEHARAFAAKVAKRKILVVVDAGCAWTLRKLYAERGIALKPEVLHVTEWLASFFRERVLKARKKSKGAFLYHDPCKLARPLGVTEEPRAVLAAVLADGAREFAWNRKDAVCCGGGGLLPESMPGTSSRMAAKRVQEAKESGATIVTACPTCRHTMAGRGVKIVDLLELVAESL